MLKQEDNERVTRVGPGTPMGRVMRSYWMPALLSEELPGPDSDPVRVRLLGENLIAFRDSNGRRRARQPLSAPRRIALLRTQ
jgi:hypothetical protein